MSEENLFEIASRKKFRFATARGDVTTEDLWDMPLSSKSGFDLDTLALSLSDKIETKSFVKKLTDQATQAKQKFDIVKYVIDSKLADRERREQEAANQEKRQKLLAALQQKRDSKLNEMSEQEIEKELEKLKS